MTDLTISFNMPQSAPIKVQIYCSWCNFLANEYTLENIHYDGFSDLRSDGETIVCKNCKSETLVKVKHGQVTIGVDQGNHIQRIEYEASIKFADWSDKVKILKESLKAFKDRPDIQYPYKKYKSFIHKWLDVFTTTQHIHTFKVMASVDLEEADYEGVIRKKIIVCTKCYYMIDDICLELLDPTPKLLLSNYGVEDFNSILNFIESSTGLNKFFIKNRIDILVPLSRRAHALSISKNPKLLSDFFNQDGVSNVRELES